MKGVWIWKNVNRVCIFTFGMVLNPPFNPWVTFFCDHTSLSISDYSYGKQLGLSRLWSEVVKIFSGVSFRFMSTSAFYWDVIFQKLFVTSFQAPKINCLVSGEGAAGESQFWLWQPVMSSCMLLLLLLLSQALQWLPLPVVWISTLNGQLPAALLDLYSVAALETATPWPNAWRVNFEQT